MPGYAQPILHYFLHLGFPLLIAYVFFKSHWKQAYLILLATMLVDLDHLLANPVFQADRCSINFHPLHTYYAMLGYVILLFWGEALQHYRRGIVVSHAYGFYRLSFYFFALRAMPSRFADL